MNNNDISLYEYAIVEIKLSENKIKEMIQQLKKDKGKYETILNNNKEILLIGFVNLRSKIDISEEASGLECIIFGLQNLYIFGKEVTKHIDWSLYKKYDDLNKKNDDLNKKIMSQMQTLLF